jgi:hypothetical protein
MDGLFKLITQDLHRDEVVWSWILGGVDEVAGRFVDRDEPLVLKKNGEGGHFESTGSKSERSLGWAITSARVCEFITSRKACWAWAKMPLSRQAGEMRQTPPTPVSQSTTLGFRRG